MRIGPYQLDNNVILAPMAGITDLPFRRLCREFGAGLTVSEMLTSLPHLQNHHRTRLKAQDDGGAGLRSVQILGTDPATMAQAAHLNQRRGAQIIDINMGCPAKKVCSVAAGSALLKDELRVAQILVAVVNAVDIPVTLKIRTGWDKTSRNALRIAQIAEQSGIQALTVHGRTRACKFNGQAEYDTIKQIKQAVNIPVVANGDIDSPEKVRYVLDYTGADAVMIGRAAQGNPWLFKQIIQSLTGATQSTSAPDLNEIQTTVQHHLDSLYHFYGASTGVKIARKHLAWYFARLGVLPADYKNAINQAQSPVEQWQQVNASFNFLIA